MGSELFLRFPRERPSLTREREGRGKRGEGIETALGIQTQQYGPWHDSQLCCYSRSIVINTANKRIRPLPKMSSSRAEGLSHICTPVIHTC
jgi:hypothetical protein